MTDRLTELSENVAKVREEANKTFEKAIKEALVVFLDTYPQVHGITWAQYAPYFNDGDVCEFRIQEVQVIYPLDYDGESDDKIDIDDEAYPTRDQYYINDDSLSDSLDLIEGILDDSLDILKSIWGSDSRVIVTREGIQVDEYTNHD